MARKFSIDTVIISDIHPEDLWQTGHLINRWCREINREMEKAMKAEAPPGRSTSPGPFAVRKHVGTGKMRAQIRGKMTKVGGEAISTEIRSHAPYTSYVHGGTAYQGYRFIYSTVGWTPLVRKQIETLSASRFRSGTANLLGMDRTGWYMRLPPPGRIYHLRVHGQKANPFMVRGYNLVAARHDALKALPNPRGLQRPTCSQGSR